MRDALAPLQPPTPRSADRQQPKGLNVLGTFAHHPDLTRAFLTFNAHLLNASTLTARHRELVVLRVAAVRDSRYEWAQHALIAADVGVTEAEVARVAAGPDAAGWTPLEAALLRAVDELVRDATLADATWAVLAEGLDERQLLDLVFTVGAYDVLAMALRTFGTPLDDDLLRP